MTEKTNPFITSNFEEIKEEKRERYKNRANNIQIESDEYFNRSCKIFDAIPYCQPVLIGHHSENRDRRIREKGGQYMSKSIKLQKKANYYQNKSESLSNNIMSNDPDALKKLKEKLTDCENKQIRMKEANKVLRKKNLNNDEKIELMIKNNLITDEQGKDLIESNNLIDEFPSYRLTNNNAQIKRIKERINELEELYNLKPINIQNDFLEAITENGFIKIKFNEGKPSDQIRNILKNNSFKWSRFKSSWTRKATNNSYHITIEMIDKLSELMK